MARNQFWLGTEHHGVASPNTSAPEIAPEIDLSDDTDDADDAAEYWVPLGDTLVPATPEQAAQFRAYDAWLRMQRMRMAREREERLASASLTARFHRCRAWVVALLSRGARAT